MRKTAVESTDPYGEGPLVIESYSTTFEVVVSGKTVVLDVEIGVLEGGFLTGSWTGKLVEVPEVYIATPGPALSLREPGGDYPLLLNECTEADYAEAVAKFANTTETTIP
jgi:hypothetical protein